MNKKKQRMQQSWMRMFEQECHLLTNGSTAGKIDWSTALNYYNQELIAKHAAIKYCNQNHLR